MNARRWRPALLAAVWTVANASALAHGAEPEDEVAAAVQPGTDVRALSRYAYWREEGTAALTLQDVIDGKAFRRSTGAIINPGVSAAVIWARVKLHNVGEVPGEWVLSTHRFAMPSCEIYLVGETGITILFDGDGPSFRESFRRFGTVATAISLAPDERVHVYLRYTGSNWSALDLGLYDAETFEDERRTDLALFFLFAAVIGALVLYGSVTFIGLGWRIVLLYVLAQVSFFGFYAHMTGFTTVYLWPEAPQSGRIVTPVTFVVFLLAVSQFARLFFETGTRLPKVDWVLAGCGVLAVVTLVLIPLDYLVPGFDRQIPLLIGYLTGLVCWLVLPCLAGYATWRWSLDNWPLAVAWTAMGTYTLVVICTFTGLVTTVPLGKQSYGVFAALEATCLALALGLRLRTLRSDLLATERRLSESLRAQLESSNESRRLAEEREWALRDLAEKGRLLLATGHDARQMLFALRGYAGALSDGTTAPRSTDERAVAAGIGEIVDGLEGILSAAVGAAHSGGIDDTLMCLDTFDFDRLVQPLRMIHEPRASRAGVELRFRASRTTLVADKVLLLRAVSNLIANALEHASATRILVTCRPCGDGWRIQVLDNGRGVEAGRLAKLLDVGTRTAPGADDTYGLGAGLAIVKAAAARLGGTLSARSTPGVGSVFELRFGESSIRDVAGARVAILDDDRAAWAGARLAAEAAGVTVEHAAAAPVNGDWTVVCMDQDFGGAEEAVELARRLRDRPACKLIIATYDRSAETRAELAPVCDLVIYKPLGGLQFRVALQHVLAADLRGERARH